MDIVDDDIPFQCVKRIKPDIFAKGQAYKERDRQIHQRIFEEEKDFYFGKSRIHETDDFTFSSSEIINNFLDIYPDETRSYLKGFSQRYSFQDIVNAFDRLKDMKILLIGDGIIDEYHYCMSMGKSAKAHLVVNKYLTHEVFAGGAFAIANHMAGFCSTVHMATLLGKENSHQEFIENNLKPNVHSQFFYRDRGPTIVKKRYINRYLNQKLFEINYIDDENISGKKEQEDAVHRAVEPRLQPPHAPGRVLRAEASSRTGHGRADVEGLRGGVGGQPPRPLRSAQVWSVPGQAGS